MGKFKAFLCWKGKRYRVDIEVMDSNTTPNVLSREFTFCMGILKPCFVLKKSTRKEDTPSMTTDMSLDAEQIWTPWIKRLP